MEYQSDEESDYAYKKIKYVSQAPLHLAWPKRINIPSEKLIELIEQGHQIVRGRFTPKEDKRIEKNWRRLRKHYPEFSDPSLAFGVTFKNSRNCSNSDENNDNYKHIVRRVSKREKNLARKVQVIHRMAYKLDNRLICDIYARCKKLIFNQSFGHRSRRELPEDIYSRAISQIFEDKTPNRIVSSELDLNPAVVQQLKRRPIKISYFRWKPENDFHLKTAIESLYPDEDPLEIPTYKISWSLVAKKMRDYGYELCFSQIYRRWLRLNRNKVGLRSIGINLHSADSSE